MLVLPINAAPAARSRATTVASAVAGAASRKAMEPARVISPSTSNKSLTETGKPAIGESVCPVTRITSAWEAAASADSA